MKRLQNISKKVWLVLLTALSIALIWYFFLAKQYKTYHLISQQGDEAVVVLYKTRLEKYYNNVKLTFKGKQYQLKKCCICLWSKVCQW